MVIFLSLTGNAVHADEKQHPRNAAEARAILLSFVESLSVIYFSHSS